MKIFEIVISFLDPTQAVAQIEADTEEEAINKLLAQLQEQAPNLEDIKIASCKEILNAPSIDAEDINSDRTLN